MAMMMAPPSTHTNTNTIDTISQNANAIHFENMLPMGSSVVKGRQKVRARKKKLTSLKKRVLMERLDQWRKCHPSSEDGKDTTYGGSGGINDGNRNGVSATTMSQSAMSTDNSKGQDVDNDANDDSGGGGGSSGTILCIKGFVNPEELEDDDEYDEIVADLTNMAHKVVVMGNNPDCFQLSNADIYIPRTTANNNINHNHGLIGYAFINFGTKGHNDARAAKECWDGLVIGGNRLSVGSVSETVMEEHKVLVRKNRGDGGVVACDDDVY